MMKAFAMPLNGTAALWVAVLLLSASGCAGGAASGSASRSDPVSDHFEIMLPASFLNPPSGVYVVTGYSIDGVSPADDAARRWLGQKRVRVSGIRRSHVRDGVRLDNRDSVALTPLMRGALPHDLPRDTLSID